jgi:hypothetical protein
MAVLSRARERPAQALTLEQGSQANAQSCTDNGVNA